MAVLVRVRACWRMLDTSTMHQGVVRVSAHFSGGMSPDVESQQLKFEFIYPNAMYYRITKATVQSDRLEEAMSTMESLREGIGKINGLVSSNLIRISETEMIGVAAYESKEHLEASENEFNELMANMMPYMARAPEVSFGEGVFSFIS